MIYVKTPAEIRKMEEGGKILGEVLSEVLKNVKEGVSEIELDRLAEKLILKRGAEPGFKMVKGYKHTLCFATNDVVVHGVPTDHVFKRGDVVGIDCGVFYKGFYTDMSETLHVSAQSSSVRRAQDKKRKAQSKDKIDKFLSTGKRALDQAISKAVVGNKVGDISQVIQKIIEGQGYSVVKSLIGHGVGKKLHEEPEIPGYLTGKIKKTPHLLPGMTLAIEVIYNMGASDVVYKNEDGWTISTKDGSISGLFERTVAITNGEPKILTNLLKA